MKELFTEFVQKLEMLFGAFDGDTHRFAKASNSEIARELGYSDAQFSRLINQSATNGEYQRAILSTDRILTVMHLEDELARYKQSKTIWKTHPGWLLTTCLLALLFFGLAGYIFLDRSNSPQPLDKAPSRDGMLRWAFETSFISPYVKLQDLPDDCNYPGYKYQGQWRLKEQYKLPFFRERSGFHYLATEINMYARCMTEKTEAGNILEGYEYQQHEIWYDKRELPIDSFIVDGGGLRDFYQQLDFATDANFVKLATVHTFFRNEFIIDSLIIDRSGKVIGRDLEFTPEEKLRETLHDPTVVRKIRNELSQIASNRLEDFSRPIACNQTQVPNANFHLIKEGDEMSFHCQLTTNRVPLNYTKTFVLTDQYIKNYCRPTP